MRHVILGLIIGISSSLFSPSLAYAEALDMDLLLPKDDKTDAAAPQEDDNSEAQPKAESPPDSTPPAPSDTTSAPPAPAAVPEPATKTTGDVLVMPPPAKAVNVTLPGRGMKKEDVEKRFGAPIEKIEAVGKPPISRWIYQDFTVFFEGDYVLHAVLKEP